MSNETIDQFWNFNSYPEWRAVFDDHKSSRYEANVKDVFVGVEAANPQKIHLMFDVEDMAAM